jgi:non-ribosomal peptide synthetase component F
MAAERRGSRRATLLAAIDRFDAGTAQRLARQLETLLKGAAADPRQAIGDLPLLDESERAQLLVGWNETAVDLSGEESVTERVARRALAAPDALAAEDGRERISYAELVSRASRLARFLEECGAGPENPVAVCLPRSVDLASALLGVRWT